MTRRSSLHFVLAVPVAALVSLPLWAWGGGSGGGGGDLPAVVISARQDLYALSGGSGGGGGDLPTVFEVGDLDPLLQVSMVRGRVRSGGRSSFSADGRAGDTASHDGSAVTGPSEHDARNVFLAGVFHSGGGGGDLPAADLSFADAQILQSPALGEVFWIGNGRVGADGSVQSILIPPGATTLSVGFVETDGSGESGDFQDNSGFVQLDFAATSGKVGKKP